MSTKVSELALNYRQVRNNFVKHTLYEGIRFVGALLWAGAGTGLGQVFGLEIAGSASTVQGGMLWVLVAGLIAYILWAVGYRFYLVKRYAAPRIDAGTLNERIV